MKVTRTLLAGAAFATLSLSALAAETAYAAGSDEGLPPNIAAIQVVKNPAPVVAERYEPQTLRDPNGQTRANPAFKAQRVERTAPQTIRAEMAGRYVGA
jgi:hypothetical protein